MKMVSIRVGIDNFIEILFDNSAREDERDDAAMYLGEYNDDRALKALITMVLEPHEIEFIIIASCGESIAQIWVNRNYFNLDIYKKMDPVARREVYGYIADAKPEWVRKYNLNELN